MVIHLTAGFLPAARCPVQATRMRPIPETGPEVSLATGQATRRLCLALHRMGFIVPRRLPRGRWALTPPFHPYRNAHSSAPRRFILCDTFHRPELAPRPSADFSAACCLVVFGLSSTGLHRQRSSANRPHYAPAALVGQPLPSDSLAPVAGGAPIGMKVAAPPGSLVNFFASWCAPCRTETDQLAALAKLPGVALYGLTQKDKPEATRAFLDEVGNPFARIARDEDGRASIEWGVYGVPETYVVDGRGIIRLKYVGPLSDAVLAEQLVPAIRAAQANP